MQSVLIIGGGFGGVALARTLSGLLRPYPNWKITLIDENPCHEFHFLLYESATAITRPASQGEEEVWEASCVPLSVILKAHNVEFIKGRVERIRDSESFIRLEDGSKMRYEVLALALGSVTETFGIPGVGKYSFFLKSYADAMRLRVHIRKEVEAARVCDPEHQRCKLRFVVVGGGFTGIELAAELAQFARKLALREYLPPDHVEVVVVEAGAEILPNLPREAASLARKRLGSHGVKFLLNTRIGEEHLGGARLITGQEVQSETIVWTAGVRANPLAKLSGFLVDSRDRMQVKPTLEVSGKRNLFAIGDCAAYIDTASGKPLPGLARVAIDQGKHAAHNISRLVSGKSLEPFVPRASYPTSVPLGGKYALYTNSAAHTVIMGFLGWLIKQWQAWQYYATIFSRREGIAMLARQLRIFSRND